MKMIDRIKDRENLTPTENQIAQYIRKSPEKVVNMSLDELASAIYVSKSTIIRFCRKLGFHGHKELCVELAKELSSFVSGDDDIDVSMPFSKTSTPAEIAQKVLRLHYKAAENTYSGLSVDSLNELAKTIFEGKPLSVYAYEDNIIHAQEICFRFQMLGYPVTIDGTAASPLTRAVSQKPNTAALFISYSGREPVLLHSARILSERNIPIYLICGPSYSTLKRMAAVTIEAGFYEPAPRQITFGSRNSVFIILDILYALVFSMDADRHMDILRKRSEYIRYNSDSMYSD